MTVDQGQCHQMAASGTEDDDYNHQNYRQLIKLNHN